MDCWIKELKQGTKIKEGPTGGQLGHMVTSGRSDRSSTFPFIFSLFYVILFEDFIGIFMLVLVLSYIALILAIGLF